MFKKLTLGVGLLSGSVIGAGVFALPYVFYRAGWAVGLFYVVAFAVLVTVSHIMYAQVVEITPGEHRLVGFSRIYLGKLSEWTATLVSPIGLLLTLTVYLILGEKFLLLFMPDSYGKMAFLVIWLLGTLVIFWETGKLALAEVLGTLSIAAIIFIIFGYGVGGSANIAALPAIDPKFIFLPYGAMLFALWGRTAIPPIVRYFRDDNRLNLVKPAIILGVLVPLLLYVLFIVGVIGLTAPYVTESSVANLASALPSGVVWLVGALGILAILTSYAVIGKNIHQTVIFDIKQKPYVGALVVALVPLLLYFAGFKNFLYLVNIVGGVFLSVEGILMTLLWRRVKITAGSWNRLYGAAVYLLLAIFIGGIIYVLTYR
ncbi:MAG: hypothetical protein M1312_02380 [Patescibacteria group bacterium]|nr:hypothetical protein [Patescibacteria group bacterium]